MSAKFRILSEPIIFNGLELPGTLSIGIAMYPVGGKTPDELYKSADLALCEAKR